MPCYLSSRSATSSIVIGALLVISTLSACGDVDTAEATPTTAAVTTTEATTTTTTTPPTTIATTTTTIATTTTEAGPDYPTYAEYRAALPPGTSTCDSRGEVVDMGGDLVSVGGPNAQISIVNGQMTVFCPGAKLVAGDPFSGVNQFGDPLEVGTLFSVNPDGSYVQLSSF